MKKTLKIILINILSIFLLIFIFDYILLVKSNYFVCVNNYSDRLNNGRHEQELPFDESKKSIITAGCSFVFGEFISQEDTFAYKLQKLTGRKVYNYGFSSTGIQHIVSRLQTQIHLLPHKRKNVNSEYFIYVFISEHVRRLYADFFGYNDPYKYFRYFEKNDKLVPKKLYVEPIDYLKVTCIAKMLNNAIYKLTPNDVHFDFLKMHILEAKRLLQEKSKDTKFVVVVYRNNVGLHASKPFITDRWSELEKEGIIVINFDNQEFDFLNEKGYLASDNAHPSARAWDALVPVIAEKLNL